MWPRTYHGEIVLDTGSLWKAAAFVGANLVLLALLIIVFPAFLAYLIAAFLLFDGALLLAAAWALWRAQRPRGRRVPVRGDSGASAW